MSSLSWDFPSSPTNPVDDDGDEVNGRGRAEDISDDDEERSEREQIEALERELLEQMGREQVDLPAPEASPDLALEADQYEASEREQIEALEREQLALLERAQMEQLAHLEAAEIEQSEQSEREQLEELEREQLRQLERLEREQNAHAPSPPPPRPPAAARSRPPVQAPAPPPEEFFEEQRRLEAEERAAQFLAASQRGTPDQAPWDGQGSGPATELRELSEPARAARAIVEHRHRNLVEANALLTEARRVLAPRAYRGLSDRAYLRRKINLGIGEAVSLAIAFSAAFDVAPLEGLLLSGAIALAFVIAGDLGGVLRVSAERSRLSAALADDVVHLDPRYHHILFHDRQPWLSIIGGVTAAVFALATVSVGVLRAANQGSVGLAAGLGLLTVSLAIAAGLSSWQHASIGSEIIEHLQREEEAAARRLKQAAAARVLRRPQILTPVRSDELGLRSAAPDLEWPPMDTDRRGPDLDWEAPTAELRVKRPKRGGRAARERPAKREKRSGSLLGAAAARGAVFLATLPGKVRR
ncbi:MAG TPA: hypothetical protein VF244_10810, partial [Acidimicrobiales bacterium]